MAKMKAANTDPLELYEKLVAAHPHAERKGAKMPYTSCNGHMFSFLTPEGNLALRLPDPQRDAFLKKYRTELCEQHGRVMQQYAVVPERLLRKTSELSKHFAVSYDYVASLKPKPTKRKKKAGDGTKAAKKKTAAKKKAKAKSTRKKKRTT